MDFFAAEAAAHGRTRRLLIAYALAVATVVGAITWVVVSVYALVHTDIYSPEPYTSRIAAHSGIAAVTALCVLGIIALASLHRIAQLRSGGGAVARSLGAVKVTRETQDPKRRRLLNIVEEIAIASGIPVPEVYVLDQEPGINAFAAGFSPSDAAVTVTRGALEQLNRAELAGVIGHEFSHVLNGDMRLNTRLAGPLFGLLVIATVARYTLRGVPGGKRAGPLVAAALLIMALGYVGVLLGRLLQAAICRQREFLADASSVQFTRDPVGLRDALVRIGRAPVGSTVATPESEDLAHLFIVPARARLFSTHPPLPERIRALDPRFDLAVLERPEAGSAGIDDELAPAGHPAALGLAGATSARPVGAVPLSDRVGNPGLDAVSYAAALSAALPAELEAALARGSTAACLWLAIALAGDAAIRARQLQLVAERLGGTTAHAVEAFGERLRSLPVVQYLPLLQKALPALKSLPADRRRALVALTAAFREADGHAYALEYLLGALAQRYLCDQVDPVTKPGKGTLEGAAAELGVLFAVIARRGAADERDARRAYERGLAALLPRRRPDYAEPDADHWPAELDRALARLRDLAPAGKELLLDALGRTILHDGRIATEEAEMLRAVAALLNCPLPPLLPLAEVG